MISDARKNHGMAIVHKHVAQLLIKIAKTGQVDPNDRALASIYASSMDKRTERPEPGSQQRKQG